MRNKNVKLLVLAALFTALTAVATLVIQIPYSVSGYVNLGDCIVLLSAWVLGPFVGAAAAGVGSALADIISGYALYAPGTFLIKAVMALVAGLFLRCLVGRKKSAPRTLAAEAAGGVLAEVLMVLGYFAYEGGILGYGLAAASGIVGNIVQGVFGLVAGLILVQILERSHALERIR